MRCLIRVETQRTVKGETSREVRDYIRSLPAHDAARLPDYLRGHWGIENRWHWSLDVRFREDERRIRQGHAAENFSRLSRTALNLPRAKTTCKLGIQSERLRCGWDHDYLLEALTKEI